MQPVAKTREIMWALCIIAYCALRVLTWNGPHPVWAAALRDIFLCATFIGMLVLMGPRAMLHNFCGKRAIARRGRVSLLIGILGCALLLPPLLWMLFARYYGPLIAEAGR